MSTDVTSLKGSRVELSEEALQELAAQLRGPTVWRPGVPEDAPPERAAFNAMHRGRPAVRIECAGTADVVDAVRFARERGLAAAVRGGGHSIAGLSTIDGGVLIDLAPMRGVQVDADRRLARVQGGALWGDVDRETQLFGLAAPGGVVSDTGVAGLTLGGGYGWLRRRYGLSCDSLVEAQVVCADGRVITASETSHPDLLWALRGGGGNFGIVTSFTFGLHPVGPTVAFAGVMYPVEEARDVLRGWREFVEAAPDEISSHCVSITFPADPEMPEAVHDRPVTIVVAMHAGDVQEGLAALQPARELGTVLADISGSMPFVALQSSFDPLFPRDELRAYWKAMYLDELSDAAIERIAARAQARPAPLTMVNAFHMGGAIAATAPEATAFAHREPPFMVSIDGLWTEEDDEPSNLAWVREAFDDIGRHGTGGVYLNFTGLADEAAQAGVDDAYGRNLRRLAEIKAVYDPENFFRRNNNIAPAA